MEHPLNQLCNRLSDVIRPIGHMLEEFEVSERELSVLILILMSKLSTQEKMWLFPEAVRELSKDAVDPEGN